MSALYELGDVKRIYRTAAGEVRALDGIDLVIGSGEFVAVEGPSGSGKSTLLQLLGALDTPTSGSLLFDAVRWTTSARPSSPTSAPVTSASCSRRST
ncbi:MAG TPA: ATP-binding cassette domain-containing protein [Candidatus Acidoferrum sp.]|nr:ATP-binding cassette domain-containing protein [Candidatus Acidoferrum sp.]